MPSLPLFVLPLYPNSLSCLLLFCSLVLLPLCWRYSVIAPEGLSVELSLFLRSPTRSSHQQFTQFPWSFSLTDSVPSPRSLQGRMPRPCPHSACGFVSGFQFLCMLCFFLPWWVEVLCNTFSEPHLGVACPQPQALVFAPCPFPVLLSAYSPCTALSSLCGCLWLLTLEGGGDIRRSKRQPTVWDTRVPGGRLLGKGTVQLKAVAESL